MQKDRLKGFIERLIKNDYVSEEDIKNLFSYNYIFQDERIIEKIEFLKDSALGDSLDIINTFARNKRSIEEILQALDIYLSEDNFRGMVYILLTTDELVNKGKDILKIAAKMNKYFAKKAQLILYLISNETINIKHILHVPLNKKMLNDQNIIEYMNLIMESKLDYEIYRILISNNPCKLEAAKRVSKVKEALFISEFVDINTNEIFIKRGKTFMKSLINLHENGFCNIFTMIYDMVYNDENNQETNIIKKIADLSLAVKDGWKSELITDFYDYTHHPVATFNLVAALTKELDQIDIEFDDNLKIALAKSIRNVYNWVLTEQEYIDLNGGKFRDNRIIKEINEIVNIFGLNHTYTIDNFRDNYFSKETENARLKITKLVNDSTLEEDVNLSKLTQVLEIYYNVRYANVDVSIKDQLAMLIKAGYNKFIVMIDAMLTTNQDREIISNLISLCLSIKEHWQENLIVNYYYHINSIEDTLALMIAINNINVINIAGINVSSTDKVRNSLELAISDTLKDANYLEEEVLNSINKLFKLYHINYEYNMEDILKYSSKYKEEDISRNLKKD